VIAMASVTHEAPETRPAWYTLPEVWASIAISVIWLAVVVTAVWAPNIVTTSVDGSSATIPSGVAVAFFAVIASWGVARYGAKRR